MNNIHNYLTLIKINYYYSYIVFRRLKVKDSECGTQRQKTELGFTIQHYENLLKEKNKLHREELELTRGLSGAKLTSDDHHRGMYLYHLNVCTLSFHVYIYLYSVCVFRSPRGLSKIFRFSYLN